jgi:hypothetical protein
MTGRNGRNEQNRLVLGSRRKCFFYASGAAITSAEPYISYDAPEFDPRVRRQGSDRSIGTLVGN